MPVAKEDRDKTAFTTVHGPFQFRRMPFGLQGAPATFQRMVDKLLDGLSEFVSVYIDDIIIFSQMWGEHLGVVLQRIQAAGLTIKSQFGMGGCVYLGHMVRSGRVRLEEVKVKAIQSFEVPRTKKQVRSFLGITY